MLFGHFFLSCLSNAQACQLIDDLRNPVTSATDQEGKSPSHGAHTMTSPPRVGVTQANVQSPRQHHAASVAPADAAKSGHEVAALKEERDELSARIGSLRAMVTSLEEQVKSSSVASTTAIAEKNQAEAVAEELRRLLDRTRERVKMLEEELEQCTAQHVTLKSQLQSIHSQVRI